MSLSADSAGLLVKPSVALRQMDAEKPAPSSGATPTAVLMFTPVSQARLAKESRGASLVKLRPR
jgi:hypothetical protein